MAFRGVDYMLFDSQLSEQELMVRQTARRFVDERVLPVIRDCYRDARFPSELIPEMAGLGFLGANLEGYGCAGMSNVEYGLIMQELERGDSGLRSFVSVQGALVMYPIYTYGSEEQKQRWLPRLQSGEAIGCFGLTEPGFGSNPAGMRTTARRDGSDWILNGEKTWITNGSVADVAVVWARTDDGVRASWWRSGTPGYRNRRHSRQIVHARFGDVQPVLLRLPRPRRERAAFRQRSESRPGLPDPGALRHRLGRHRRRHGLLRNRAANTDPAQAVRRPAASPPTSSCRRNSPG